jgi:arylsulfatase
VQYHYIFGPGSIYKDGWKAAFAYYPDRLEIRLAQLKGEKDNPILTAKPELKWELYNLNEDFNELHDLASKNPEKLKELQALFDQQAQENNVYPLIDWVFLFSRKQDISDIDAVFRKSAGGHKDD